MNIKKFSDLELNVWYSVDANSRDDSNRYKCSSLHESFFADLLPSIRKYITEYDSTTIEFLITNKNIESFGKFSSSVTSIYNIYIHMKR